MEFGVQQIFQNFDNQTSDGQVWQEEVRLGLLAEELGFDSIWPVEHHFCDYAACPDNLQFLSYMAARTKRIKLATGAIILPWNNPLRVVEKVSVLDHLSGGRVVLGLGRGLARREYEGFGIDMDSSRERFDEAAGMVLEALDTGFIEGSGRYYPQTRTPIRPRPLGGFRDRVYSIAMSPDSVEAAARLGTGMAVFSQKSWEMAADDINSYRALFSQVHGKESPPPVTCDFVICDNDQTRAEELARRHITGYLVCVFEHYELMSEHFKKAKGYEMYGSSVDMMRAIGLENLMEEYLKVQAWGTPERIIEALGRRREMIGDYNFSACFRFAGIPFEAAEASMRLFAEAVMPVLRQQTRNH